MEEQGRRKSRSEGMEVERVREERWEERGRERWMGKEVEEGGGKNRIERRRFGPSLHTNVIDQDQMQTCR